MNKKTLTSLFTESLYRIPDYQRGYAWEEKQWKDFIQDIDALVDEQVTSHYTGTVVVYDGRDAEVRLCRRAARAGRHDEHRVCQ